jgi:RimJ/RimL family protein N-acetyltransferase
MTAEVLRTQRLTVEPLRVCDADELAEVLGDDALYAFIGGRPASAVALRRRYERLVAGSAAAGEIWLNWVVRAEGDAVGTLQATLVAAGDMYRADVAWVIGVPWQGRGYASEGARALVEWLRERGVDPICAKIHPEHAASATVAQRAGLQRTDALHDGEVVWQTTARLRA